MRKVCVRLARHTTALAFVALVAIGVGVAVAAIPNDGIIKGCRNKNSGALRVIDPQVSKCATSEVPLDWAAFAQDAYAQTPAGFQSTLFAGAGDLEIFTAHVPPRSYMVTATVIVVGTTGGAETVVKCQIASSDGRGSTGETLLKDIDETTLTLQAPGDPANGTWGVVCSATNRPLSGPGNPIVDEVSMSFVPAGVTSPLSTNAP